MIIVTGGAGFIGSNLVRFLNRKGHQDIIVVDDLSDGHKFVNLVDCEIADYLDKVDFLDYITADYSFGEVDAIYHQGACSATTEWDGQYMMANNYEYSKTLLHYCQDYQIPFLYASSAAVYGGNETFLETPQYESPLNVYGYSKLLFDQYVRRVLPDATSQIAGFRYFNVYGPREQHKDSMASVAYHFSNQIHDSGQCKLFAGTDGYDNGEQRRDFVYVEDVCEVNWWFAQNPQASGIFNCGTGRSQTFNEMADAVIASLGKGEKSYIEFPEHLKGAYQSYTEANLDALRAIGCDVQFKDVSNGVAAYMASLNDKS